MVRKFVVLSLLSLALAGCNELQKEKAARARVEQAYEAVQREKVYWQFGCAAAAVAGLLIGIGVGSRTALRHEGQE